MKEWVQEFQYFWKNKIYRAALLLTALFGYGFLITHQTVGIDDTPAAYYFEEGLATVVGRWVMFVVNKIFHIAEFAPFVTDLAGVMIFLAAVTVWCVLLRRILGEKLPMYGYVLFACLFLSNPLICEVYTYYLHNGVATGYLFGGISLLCLWEGIGGISQESENGKPLKGPELRDLVRSRSVLYWACSVLALWVSVGCYESFMIVYLVGFCLMLGTARAAGKKVPVWRSILLGATAVGAAMVLRSLMVKLLVLIFDLGYLQTEGTHRSIAEMVSWIAGEDALANVGMMLKRIFVMYGVFAYAYYPIKIYVLALFAALVWSIVYAIRRKDAWIVLLTIGALAASYLLCFVEGKTTLYRSAQFLPLFSAWGIALAVWGIGQLISRRELLHRWGNRLICFGLCAILWNQCTDMNRWFYVDWLKYEDARNVMNQVAYELEKNYDTTKPVVFTGTYTVPTGIVGDALVSYNDMRYFKMRGITDKIDEELIEKFFREDGVWTAQTPMLSVLDWGKWAFENTEEMVRFFAMHGHTITPYYAADEVYTQIEVECINLPKFPAAGSIVDAGDYIIVHF